MYAMPGFGYGCVHVKSISQIIREIKCRQTSRPLSKFFIQRRSSQQTVGVLQNGYIEWGGKVRSQAYEDELEMGEQLVFLVEQLG